MKWMESAAFLLYLGLLAHFDRKTRKIPAALILAGSGTGLLLRLLSAFRGELTPAALLWHYGTGLLWGLILLLAVRPGKGAVGTGDGLCFLSFALWQDNAFVFSLLLLSLLLLALYGLLVNPGKKERFRQSLPLMPFAWIAAAGFLITELIQEALR